MEPTRDKGEVSSAGRVSLHKARPEDIADGATDFFLGDAQEPHCGADDGGVELDETFVVGHGDEPDPDEAGEDGEAEHSGVTPDVGLQHSTAGRHLAPG